MFTSRWAVPAVKIPAGRQPGMFKAPRGRSRQPMASTTALGCSWNRPSVRFMAVTVLSAARSSTMVSSL